jgi:hypothetical protein
MTVLLKTWPRRFLMIVVPLILVVMESFHPSGFSKDVYHGLSHLADWWKILHICQSFLFGGMAVAAVLLTLHLEDFWGTLSKVFIWLFAVCYLVFDAIAGISVGSIIVMSQENPNLDLNTVKTIVQNLYNDPFVGGTRSFYSLTGSWSWLLGIASAIVALYRNNRSMPRWQLIPPLILLAISAYFLYVGHFAPYGPIAFFSFALASLWFEYFHFGPCINCNKKDA